MTPSSSKGGRCYWKWSSLLWKWFPSALSEPFFRVFLVEVILTGFVLLCVYLRLWCLGVSVFVSVSVSVCVVVCSWKWKRKDRIYYTIYMHYTHTHIELYNIYTLHKHTHTHIGRRKLSGKKKGAYGFRLSWRNAGTQCTCFTGTKVQILTQKALRSASPHKQVGLRTIQRIGRRNGWFFFFSFASDAPLWSRVVRYSEPFRHPI